MSNEPKVLVWRDTEPAWELVSVLMAAPEPDVDPEPPDPPVIVPTTLEMHVRSVALTTEQQVYLGKLKECGQLKSNGTRPSGNLDTLSRSGRLKDIGRNLAIGTVPILTALRFTGDKDLLNAVLPIMDNLKTTMQRPAGWFDEGPETTLQTAMELLLSYAFIAQVTWAFKQNADVDPRYAEEAAFWENHLLHGFVPRHGEYLRRLRKPLMHPFTARIRLLHYLWKITDDDVWKAERDSEFAKARKEWLKVGDRYAVTHFVNHLRSTPAFALQHTNYFGETLLSIADLGFEGVIDDATMKRFAKTVTWMSDGDSPNFLKGANGVAGTYRSELLERDVEARPMDYPRCGEWTMRARGYGLLSYWDETGEIEGLCLSADNGNWTTPLVGALIAR